MTLLWLDTCQSFDANKMNSPFQMQLCHGVQFDVKYDIQQPPTISDNRSDMFSPYPLVLALNEIS